MRKISLALAFIFIVTNMFMVGGFAAEESAVLSATFESWPWLSNTNIPSNWSNSGTQSSYVSKDSSTKVRGSYGVKVTDTLTTATAGVKSNTFSVTAGKTYKLKAKGYVHEGYMNAFIRFLDSSGTKVGSDIIGLANIVGQWNDINVSGIAPEGAVKAQVYLHGHQATVGTVTWDEVYVYGYGYTAPTQGTAVNSQIVAPNGSKLKYTSYDDKGNTLSDFSYAGFYAGKVEIPDTDNTNSKMYVHSVLEAKPWTAEQIADGTAAKDDTLRIQTAIDNATAAVESGELAIVKLKAGNYYVADTKADGSALRLKSNVVLSGEGQGPTGTVIRATGKRTVKVTTNDDGSTSSSTLNYIVLRASGTKPSVTGTAVKIADSYIKSGSTTFNVADASQFKVGDLIKIYHPSSAEWDKYMEMTTMSYNGTSTKWEGKVDMNTERVITAISGNTITVDFPFFVHYDMSVAECTVQKLNDSRRLENIGVENLRIESDFNKNDFDTAGRYDDEDHANYGIYMSAAKNCYIQDVTFKHILHSSILLTDYTKQVTVRNCSILEPVSIVEGGKRYSFAVNKDTQQILITGCYSNMGRHDYETSFTCTGPVVFSDSVADQTLAASETHGTWSTGVLYDNMSMIGDKSIGFFASTNRGIYGTKTSQGWSGAGVVFWNTLASTVIANDPSGDYQNFLVGISGLYSTASSLKTGNINTYKTLYKTDSIAADSSAAYNKFTTASNTSLAGDAYKEATTTPVEPRSLYKAQLAQKVTGSFKNGKPNAPVIVSPMPDDEYSSYAVRIDGFYQKGATDVNVYVDGEKIKATLNSSDNTFFTTVEGLSRGVHKIYATQVIGGVEGNKTADRFISVGSSDGEYTSALGSNYPVSTLSLIQNDNRLSYDRYLLSLDVDELPEELPNPTVSLVNTATQDNVLIVKSQTGPQAIYGKYGIFATKVPEYNGYEIKEYGVLVSVDEDIIDMSTYTYIVPSVLELTDTGAYGVLLYNLPQDKPVYVRPYTIYKARPTNEFVGADAEFAVCGQVSTVE
ncbi:MAG: hypothetical protein E7411_00785 [Ruminococcaceae bacterium]|nr:hypothetical protein [Oscillospiraceae bacterium]